MKSKTATQPVNHRSAWRTLLGMVVILSLAHALSAQAAITVTSLNDSGPGSLRQAIADAAPGDTIDFAVTGTITLTSGELVITNNLTISGPGATNLTVSGNNASRVFGVGTSGVVTLSGLALANGSAYDGGGIMNWGTLTVSNCILKGNQAVNGGGAAYNRGTITFAYSTICSNGASNSGGGLWNFYGTLDVSSSTIFANRANQGGGIANHYGLFTLTNSTVSGNSVSKFGGGGIHTGGSSGNAIVNSTICSNNSALGAGGGIQMDSGTLDLRNSIAVGNSSILGPDCFVGSGSQLISQDYNLIQNTNWAPITGVTAHNIYGKDPLLGPLADNGGPTMTHALLPGSPAIDHGSSGGLATDQRGLPRIFNFPAYFAAADGSDIGAYELQERAQTGPVFTVNSNDDVDDGLPGIAHCSLREAINAANANFDFNSIVFATGVPGLYTGVSGTITLTNGELAITEDAAVTGPGAANLTISGNHASRVFRTADRSVSISGLTIANGRATGDSGGGILGLGALTVNECMIRDNSADGGGGICYGGSDWLAKLTIANSVLVSNVAVGLGGAALLRGDGRYSRSSIILGTTISANSALYGGGVACGNSDTTGLTNCTISGNTATQYGGGIALFPGAIAYVESSTVCSNSAPAAGGIWKDSSSSLASIRNSIIAGNSGSPGPDYQGELNSLDYNLIQNTSGCTIMNLAAHNIYGQDPLLGPLTNNGGSTLTHALLPGSPAIDQGIGGGLATDQRGQIRPVDFPGIANAGGGDGSDIGAYEVRDLAQTGPVFTVNSNNDTDDGIPGVLHCSLREAIASAAPGDTIDFAVTGTITLTNGELAITNNLTIRGPGATNLTVSGNNASRVFSFNGVTAAISGLTVAHGYVNAGGGGILNSSSTLTVSNCTLRANATERGWGGGVYNNGTLIIIDSAIFANSANQNWGGGISSDGVLRLTNTTVSGNSATYGGGILLQGPSSVVNSTICSNKATARAGVGGGVFVLSGNSSQILSSIISGNSSPNGGPDCFANNPGSPLQSLDYNLIQNTNGAAITGVTTHNIYGKDPLLGPLADNGGPTPTHALLPGSPAIDHGSSGGLATDQRGQPRIFNFPAYLDAADGSDIGAYELQERAQTGPVFTVNSNDDVDDGVPGIAHCSLREAIAAANANADMNTIDFAAEVPSLRTGVTGTITLTNGQLAINNSVNINGPGAANLTVSGNNASRVFNVGLYVGNVAISGLTIANGNCGGGSESGGGILNSGTLSLTDCTVSNCTSIVNSGGGLANLIGSATLLRCNISGNTGGLGGGVGNTVHGSLSASACMISSNFSPNGGAGIDNSAYAELTDCTISGNTVTGSGVSGGGGVLDRYGGLLYLNSCTVCSNNAGGGNGGGGIHLSSGTVTIRDTILSGNSASAGPDCSGSFNSLDYNLIQNTNGCTITNLTTHNLYNQDPKLGPLADLGGPTPTHALRFDSPALDAGNSGGLIADQRGLPRPIDSPDIANAEGGDGSDIGAYEADPNLRITGFGKTGADIWLSFNSVWGRTYRVETTDQLPPTWNVLTNGVIGTGGRFQALDGGAASLPSRYYRAVLLMP